MLYGEGKKLRDEHVAYHKGNGTTPVALGSFLQRLASGRELKDAIQKPSRGIGGSIYYGPNQGKKVYYKIINR